MKLKRDIIFYNPTWKNDKTIYDYIRIHNIEMARRALQRKLVTKWGIKVVEHM